MPSGLSELNRALNRIPKRAEQRQAEQLRATFVDSGVAALLDVSDHQVLYGRRGTGKTHALRFIEGHVRSRGDVAIYLDLRTVGSPDGLFLGAATPPTDRAAKLLVDLLGQVHEGLLGAAIDDDSLLSVSTFVAALDRLATAITTVGVDGEVEVEHEGEVTRSRSDSAGLTVNLAPTPGIEVSIGTEQTTGGREANREVRRGTERIQLNFSQIAGALRDVAAELPGKRLWLLLDEWSSVPPEVQPFVGEFLVRCVLPLQPITVKIAAIEQQTNFRSVTDDGTSIGIEVGADVFANVDLDEFMVFEQDEARSRDFFCGLFFKHLTSGLDDDDPDLGLAVEADFVRRGFTDKRAFDELLRACEGVPRDAINIAGKAAFKAGDNHISVPNVRQAAREWYVSDKEAAIRSHPDAIALLNWIIDEVIKGKRARGFLVNQSLAGTPLLLALFDARVLHVVRRGYSAQDQPGERFDVWVVDYGAYVDMLHTQHEPQGLLALGEGDEGEQWVLVTPEVDVPTHDFRAIRRAILDLDAFGNRQPSA